MTADEYRRLVKAFSQASLLVGQCSMCIEQMESRYRDQATETRDLLLSLAPLIELLPELAGKLRGMIELYRYPHTGSATELEFVSKASDLLGRCEKAMEEVKA